MSHIRLKQLRKPKKVVYEEDEETGSMSSDYLNEENEILEVDQQTQTLRKLVQKSRKNLKIIPSKITTQDKVGQKLHV
ncbi:8048_t:CDS:2 [Cetraspora pellucida]|uniref:8048_t:CDS:1 n=1 Tax=Cetraspora pellucida TaxID=1433469 RepID=A0ACA9KN81_9GLOM|nr:8048_t:CDS:2 [Cetraspora pellucida]